MLIELKNVRYFAAGSEETSCFVATIYVDGKKAGDARNEGHGGMTMISPRTLEDQLNAYGATLPPEPLDMGDGTTFESKQDAESLIDGLLTRYLLERDLRKALSKRIVYTKKGAAGIYQTKTLPTADMAKILGSAAIHEKWQIDKLLNALPFAEALAIYCDNGA